MWVYRFSNDRCQRTLHYSLRWRANRVNALVLFNSLLLFIFTLIQWFTAGAWRCEKTCLARSAHDPKSHSPKNAWLCTKLLFCMHHVMISMFQVKVRTLNATMHVPLSMECYSCKPCINSTVFLIFSVDFFVIAFCWSRRSCSISKMLRLFGSPIHMQSQKLTKRQKRFPRKSSAEPPPFASLTEKHSNYITGQNTLEANWLIRKWVLL